MRTRTTATTSLLLMIAFGAVTHAASPRPKATSKRKASAVAPETRLRIFDASVDKLPPNFTGASVQTAFRTFRVLPKGEYETTAEHEARVKRLPWGIYAFAVPKRFAAVSYDADSETLSATVKAINPAVGFESTSEAGVELARENERERKYMASNAFGASILVEEYAYSSYSLITDVNELPVLTFSLARAKAPATKDDLRILVVVALDENSFIVPEHEVLKESTGFRHAEPTFDDPTEVTISDYSLRAQLLQLWLFKRSTGEVLGRFNPDGQVVEPQ